MSKKILIVGGGYGGLNTAIRLQKRHANADITLISKHDYHYQTTLLHKVAIGTLSDRKAKIYYRDIIYLYKSKGAKYVNYVTEDGIYRERISLEAALKELDSRIFIPAGRGYVVNMRRILKIRRNVLYMEKGYEVQVSQAKLSEVKQQISRCWREI